MSKGIEAFKRIGNAIDHADEIAWSYFEEGDFDIVDKELKALEIIKEKQINIDLFNDTPNIDEYNYWCSDRAILTKEEYDLLKEVLL